MTEERTRWPQVDRRLDEIEARTSILGAGTDVSTLDLEDLPTGVFRRVAPEREPEPDAAPTPVVTGTTVRVPLADVIAHADAARWAAAAAFAGPVPPLLDDSPVDQSAELDLRPRVDPREHKRRRIEAILGASKRRSAEAAPGHAAPRPPARATADPPRARTDRFARVDCTPQVRALYEAALRDLERGA